MLFEVYDAAIKEALVRTTRRKRAIQAASKACSAGKEPALVMYTDDPDPDGTIPQVLPIRLPSSF